MPTLSERLEAIADEISNTMSGLVPIALAARLREIAAEQTAAFDATQQAANTQLIAAKSVVIEPPPVTETEIIKVLRYLLEVRQREMCTRMTIPCHKHTYLLEKYDYDAIFEEKR